MIYWCSDVAARLCEKNYDVSQDTNDHYLDERRRDASVQWEKYYWLRWWADEQVSGNILKPTNSIKNTVLIALT